MLALGRVSLYNKLWGKAKDFFELSLQIMPTSVAYAEMARLLTKLGENEKSNEYFRKGLLVSTDVVEI